MSARSRKIVGIAVVGFISIGAAIFLSFILKKETEPVEVMAYDDYANCSHDDTYVEPILSDGNYYLNADTTQCYFAVRDNTIQLMGNEEQLQVLADMSSKLPYPTDIKTIKETWSEEKPYYIFTIHPLDDTVVIAWVSVVFDENGNAIRGSGANLTSDTCISGYISSETNFIRVDENSSS